MFHSGTKICKLLIIGHKKFGPAQTIFRPALSLYKNVPSEKISTHCIACPRIVPLSDYLCLLKFLWWHHYKYPNTCQLCEFNFSTYKIEGANLEFQGFKAIFFRVRNLQAYQFYWHIFACTFSKDNCIYRG